MMMLSIRRAPLLAGAILFAVGAAGCATSKAEEPPPEPVAEEPLPPGAVSVVEYEAKTAALVQAMEELEALQGNVDEQRRRLQVICADYPDHDVCKAQTNAAYAKKAFCEDENFVQHVDEIVKACHQGACKEVDEANLLGRTEYMTLVSNLPHKLITFRNAETRLDDKDKRALQQYIETIGADGGYVIIVGRASKDGPWRDNLRYALDRAENTRSYLVDSLGLSSDRVGYITYGHEKMYLTKLDAERLAQQKLTTREANRSALLFVYPCFNGAATASAP